MHPKRSSSQQSRVTSSNLYSIHPRQLAIPIKTRLRRKRFTSLFGTSATNCTSEIIELNVTSVTDAPTGRVGPKVTSLEADRRMTERVQGRCQKRVKGGSRDSPWCSWGWSLGALTTEDTKLHTGRPNIFDHS